MHILFLTHYFPPEGNAPAVRVYEMARRWVKAGHVVTVITGVPNVPAGVVYEGYRNRRIQREEMEGIRVVRVWTYIAANKDIVRRILNYLSYMFSAIFGSVGIKPDVVIATSPQFFCGWAGAVVSRLKRRPFILEVRDIWPESIIAVGALDNNFLINLLQRMERSLYKRADLIVTVGHGYRTELVSRRVPADKIRIVSNGVDLDLFSPRNPDADLLVRYGLVGSFVCSYVGTIGMACGLDVVLRAAELLRSRNRNDVKFLLVGDGAVREQLQAKAEALALDSVVFTGRLDKDMIPRVLSVTDACLVHLRRESLFRTVLPSKMFEASAMEKPIILGVEGQAARLVETAGAGVCIEPEDEEQLARAVERLAGNRDWCRKLGRSGRQNLAAGFDYNRLAAGYLEMITAFVKEHRNND